MVNKLSFFGMSRGFPDSDGKGGYSANANRTREAEPTIYGVL